MRDLEQERLERELGKMKMSPKRKTRRSPIEPLLTPAERTVIGLALLKHSHFTEAQRRILGSLVKRRILGAVWGTNFLTARGKRIYRATEKQMALFKHSPRMPFAGTLGIERAYHDIRNALVGIYLDGVKNVSPFRGRTQMTADKAREYLAKGSKTLAWMQAQRAPRGPAARFLERHISDLKRIIENAQTVFEGAPQKMTETDYKRSSPRKVKTMSSSHDWTRGGSSFETGARTHGGNDLVLTIDNEGSIYEAKQKIIEKIKSLIASGRGDVDKLSRLMWSEWVRTGAARYRREGGRPTPADIQDAIHVIVPREHGLILSGEYGPVKAANSPRRGRASGSILKRFARGFVRVVRDRKAP